MEKFSIGGQKANKYYFLIYFLICKSFSLSRVTKPGEMRHYISVTPSWFSYHLYLLQK